MKIASVSLSLLVYFSVYSQSVRNPLAVRYSGLGAYSIRFVDAFSGIANQASLSRLPGSSLAIFGERRFSIKELSGYSSILVIPTIRGTFGFQADYFGSDSFNETQLGLIYSKKVAEKIDVGTKFNFQQIRIGGTGSASTINFEGGVIFHISDALHTGFHIYNPTGSYFNKQKGEKLGSMYRFGMGYELSKEVFVSLEILKQEDRPVGVNAGFQWNFYKNALMRSGINSVSSQLWGGIGLPFTFGRFDITTAYHPQLGFTPGLLVLIKMKKETGE